MYKFKYVCVAGTFDGIHVGHEALLNRAFDAGERVLIGITSDEYVLRYKSLKSPKVPKSLTKRKQDLIGWLAAHGYASDRYEIIPIDDPFEPAASDPTLDALVVSEETRDRGEELNALRKSRGFKPLTLIVIPMIPANGKLVMPETLRSELAKPLGKIISFKRGRLPKLIITVGDVTTKAFLDAGTVPQLMIIDHKVNRKPFFDLQSSLHTLIICIIKVTSGPGYISKSAIDAIRKAFGVLDKPTRIEVEGEEDLLVLPVISEAPLGARVYYGQPGRGMVEVIVTAETKKKADMLFSKFVSP